MLFIGLLLGHVAAFIQNLRKSSVQEEFLAACETLHQVGYTPIQGSIYTIYYNLMRNGWGYQLATTEDPPSSPRWRTPRSFSASSARVM